VGKKLLVGDELEARARELGVSVEGDLIRGPDQRYPRASDFELQRRVQEAERSLQGAKLWLVAFISACASLASAIAAWVAVWKAS